MAYQDEPDLSIALTVDIDPDANRPVPGRPDAVSARADEARHEACFRGLAVILAELEDRGLPATFFWEARTAGALHESDRALLSRALANEAIEHGCHGLRHEDFAGKMSGTPLGQDQTRTVMQEATERLTRLTGAPPRGFRAPYCRLTPALRTVLSDLGYAYDASLTEKLEGEPGIRPQQLDNAPGVRELPLVLTRDEKGRPMSAYLWQLFKGNRAAGEYAALARRVAEGCPGGLLQMALHPWHLFLGTEGLPSENGPERLSALLDALQGLDGVRFTTDIDYLRTTLRGA